MDLKNYPCFMDVSFTEGSVHEVRDSSFVV